MYIDNQIKRIRVKWPPITIHTYERVSRSKWRIKLNYACGAEMTLENIPDDVIQSLVLGAFNSRHEIETSLGAVSGERPDQPPATWAELQPLLIG